MPRHLRLLQPGRFLRHRREEVGRLLRQLSRLSPSRISPRSRGLFCAYDVIILRSQVSAIRFRVRVFSTRCRFGPESVPEPDNPCPMPDCRDLGPEDECTSVNYRVSLCCPFFEFCIFCSTQPLSLPASDLFPLSTCQLASLPARYPLRPTGRRMCWSTDSDPSATPSRLTSRSGQVLPWPSWRLTRRVFPSCRKVSWCPTWRSA